MDSSSPQDPRGSSPNFDHGLIEKEIAHLRKKNSTRTRGESTRYASRTLMVGAALGLLWFYAMDPFWHAYYRGDAIRAYLYLHNYGNDRQAAALADSGIFTTYETQLLNKRQGSFQDYYTTPVEAEAKAQTIIRYLQGVRDLAEGKYATLTPANRVRYVVFVKCGIYPPTEWDVLNPSIGP